MPRLWSWSSTLNSSDICYIPGTSDPTTSSSLGTTATGIGFFAGLGELSRGNNGIGMRIGDVLMHVSKDTLVSTDGTGNLSPFPGRVTFHSVVASTPNGSTVSSSVAWDVTVSQPSLG